jgi:hypothetical protein
MEKLSQEQLERASASRTLARIPVLNDPVITEAMAALEEPQYPIDNPQPTSANPCVEVFGPGPEGELCGSCANLHAARICDRGNGPSRTFYFCTFNVTARRVTAPACSRFVLPLPPVAADPPPAVTGGSPS